jgi:Domain of unknown function (DUF4386)
MTFPNFLRYAGWAAILSAAASLLMVLTAILSSALKLGNTFSVVVMILMALMIVVALALHLILSHQGQSFSLVAAAIGILGMLLMGIVHALMMAGILTQEQFNATGEGIGPAGIGLWLLLVNYLALRGKVLRRGLTWVGLIAGVGYLMSGVGALIGGSQTLVGGPQNPLSSVGPLGILFVYPIWAIWLGRGLLAESRTPQLVTSKQSNKRATSKSEELHDIR